MNSILDEAKKIVNGSRQTDYGEPNEAYEQLARAWSLVLNCRISAAEVVLCLLQMKILRQVHRDKRDNLVDIAGYAEILDRIEVPERSGVTQPGNDAGEKEDIAAWDRLHLDNVQCPRCYCWRTAEVEVCPSCGEGAGI